MGSKPPNFVPHLWVFLYGAVAVGHGTRHRYTGSALERALL
jgi:hypothetical protein